MRERSIIFNAEMVRAVLEGRKTQTRRIMKVQPESNQYGLLRIIDSTNRSNVGKCHWAESNATGTHSRSKLFSYPFGAVGDRMWVRETWSDVNLEGSAAVAYRADEGLRGLNNDNDDGDEDDPRLEKYSFENWYPDLISGAEGIWRPSIHMPRWASRITLEITGVRVEKLASISPDDARAKGYPVERDADGGHLDPWLWFRDLWDGIYPDQSFKANPWVWVIEFKRVEGVHVQTS